MKTKGIETKIDVAAHKAKNLMAEAGTKAEAVAGTVGDATTEAGAKLERAAKEGGHRLSERMQQAGQAMEALAEKVMRFVQGTARSAILKTQALLTAAEHRLDEMTPRGSTGGANDTPKESVS